jgi:beta-lactamase class A
MMKQFTELEKHLLKFIQTFEFKGTVGLVLKDLDSGAEINLNAERRFSTASVIKVPILVEVFCQVKEKKLELTDTLTYRKRRDKVPGSGVLQHLSDETKLKLIDACVLMTVLSDNTATNMLIDLVGVKNVNQRMASLGLNDILLFRKSFKNKAVVHPDLCKKYGFGMSTPRDMNRLLEMIYAGKVVDKKSCKIMIDIMKNQFYDHGIRAHIMDPGVWVANKTGSVTGVRNDVGIIHSPKGTWALSIFTELKNKKAITEDNLGLSLIATCSMIIFHYYRTYK